jgi:peptide deformylase
MVRLCLLEEDRVAENIDDLRKGGTVLPITRWSEAVMRSRTEPVTAFDDDLRALVTDMFATMRAADGVGLAATQVGRGLAVFVYDCPDDDHVRHVGAICNATVDLPTGKDRRLDAIEEGCLSFPGAYEALARPDHCVCRGQDPWGNDVEVVGTGLLARCLQHETDHLNGIVFGDRLSARSRRKLDTQQEELDHLYPSDWPVTPRRTSATEDA